MAMIEIPVPDSIDRRTFAKFKNDELLPYITPNSTVRLDKGTVNERSVILWDNSLAPVPTNQELLALFQTWRASNPPADFELEQAKVYLQEQLTNRLVRHIGLKAKPRIDALPTVTRAAVRQIIDEEVDAFISRVDP